MPSKWRARWREYYMSALSRLVGKLQVILSVPGELTPVQSSDGDHHRALVASRTVSS